MARKKVTHILVISLFLTLGFGQLLRFDAGTVHFYMHDFLVTVLLLLHIPSVLSMIQTASARIRVAENKFQLLRYIGKDSSVSGIILIIAGMAGGWTVALITLPLSALDIPALYSIRFLAYLLLYQILRYRKVKIESKYIYCAMGISAVAGIAQYLFMPDMRIFKYLGWDDHLNRLVLPHFDPTYSGVMLSMFMLYALEKKKSVGSVMLIPLIFLTYARSVWIALLATSLVMQRRHKKYIAAAVVITAVAVLLLPRRFGEGTNLLRRYSITARAVHDASMVRQMGWKNMTGVGMNTLPAVLGQNPSSHATGPNNSYLFMMMTAGVTGLAGLVVFLKKLYSSSQYKSVIVFVVAASMFNNVLFYPFVLLWLLLMESVTVPSGS